MGVQCLIVDDHQDFLEAARTVLERQGLAIALARRLVAHPAHEARVILISTRSEAELADVIALSRAAGFLSKSELSADAIRGFLDGRRSSTV